jgi:hypothetical protein
MYGQKQNVTLLAVSPITNVASSSAPLWNIRDPTISAINVDVASHVTMGTRPADILQWIHFTVQVRAFEKLDS